MDSEQLQRSSRRWMNAALAAFVEGEQSYDFAVHHAGVAAEHLLKAYLAHLHPVLIVDGRDFDSLLHATGLGSQAGPLTKIKTIGLAMAHERVRRFLQTKIPIDKKALEPLADARNGVAHTAIHDSAQAETVFTICLRLVDPVLKELKIDATDYWGPYLALHDKLVDEQVQQERVAVEAMLARARSVFEQRFGRMSPNERDVVLQSIITRTWSTTEPGAPKECPACGSEGWLTGFVNIQGIAGQEVVYLNPYQFDCTACDLEVEAPHIFHMGDLAEEVIADSCVMDYIVRDAALKARCRGAGEDQQATDA